MNRRERKARKTSRVLLIAALLLTAPCAVWPCYAFSSGRVVFDIPSQSLEEALREYARETGQQIAYQAADIDGKTAQTVRGVYSAKAGLEALLSGTGLKAERLRSGVYRIYLPRAPQKIPPVVPRNDVALEAAQTPAPVVVIRGNLSDSELGLKRRDTLGRDTRIETSFRKLPEGSVPDMLQHMGGVQVASDRGDISRIGIRGLSEVNTLINGREIYSDAGRTLSLEYIPTNTFAGIDIYRTSKARMIEGGVGGAIDLRMRRPLDLKDGEKSLVLRLSRRDHSPATVQATALYSKRFQTRRGEAGLLISFADLPTLAVQDSVGIEPFGERNDIDRNGDGLANDLVLAPRGGGGSSEGINRRRTALQATGQWRPSDQLTMALELTGFGYTFSRDSYVIYANRGALTPMPGVRFAFSDDPGEENVVQSGAYTGVVFTSNTNYYDLSADTGQAAFNVDWSPDAATSIEIDLSHTLSLRKASWGGLRIGNSGNAMGSVLTFDLGGLIPQLRLSGFDTANFDNYNLIDSSHSLARAEGSGTALQMNVNRKLTGTILKSVDLGFRLGSRDIESMAGTRQHVAADLPIAMLPDAASNVPVSDFFQGRAGPGVFGAGILGAPPELVRDIGRVCDSVGDTVCYPDYNPAQGYRISETTRAGYTQFNYEWPVLGGVVTGNAGVRFIEMNRTIAGTLTSNLGVLAPVHIESQTFDILPSFNARIAVAPDLHVRMSAGRQLTRPSFAQLSPALTVGYANANRTLTAFVGNPELKALRSTSIDLSVEKYFPSGSYAYGILFRKKVDGFVQAVLRNEPVAFQDYPGFDVAEMTRLQNGSGGVIQGYQLGLVAAFRSQPVPWKGLSVQANFTHVDSTAPSPIAGSTVPLVGLSRNNYNLVLTYESGRFRSAASYTYRDDFVDTITGPGSGSLPVFSRPYGSFDASVGFRFTSHVEIDLELSNIGRSQQGSYFGVPDRPRFVVEGLRQASLVLRFTG